MAARFIFEQVQKMSPASFSQERHCYLAEKIMLRQFVLLKQRDHIPDHFSVRDMKTWLLKGRSFLEEFQVAFERTGMPFRFMAELAWTTARLFCLGQVEQEVLEDLEKEEHLSQLFSRKVTLDGFQMFVSDARPEAEEDVQSLLKTLHRKLLQIFGSIHITSDKLSAGDAKPAEFLELEQSTASLVPEVVDIALKFLLEEPEREDKTDAASVEIGKLLTNSVTTCLSRFGSVTKDLLLRVCTIAAQPMVIKIYKTLVQRSKSFHLMDYDESFYFMSAVQNMDFKGKSDPSNQGQLEKELVEKKVASPQVSPEDMSTFEIPADGTMDRENQLSKLLNATLKGLQVFLSVVHPLMEEDVKSFLPTLHKRLLQIFGGLHIASGQLSAGDTKPPELLGLELSTAALVPEVVGTALKFLLEKPKQEFKSNAASTEIGKLLTNAVAPFLSCIRSISKGILLRVCTITARFMVKAICKTFDQCSKSFHLMDYDKNDTSAREGTTSAVHDMAHKVQADASSQAQVEERLLGFMEAFQQLSLNDEKDTLSNCVIEDTSRKEEILEESVVKNMDHKVQTDPSSQALPQLEELLEKREASVEVPSAEEQTDPSSHAQLEEGLLGLVEAFKRLSLNDEEDTLSNCVIGDTSRKEEILEESAVKNMDHEVQTDPSSQALPQLEELLEKREASVEVPSAEEQTDPSSQAQLEEGCLGLMEAFQWLSLNDEEDTLSNCVIEDTSRKEEILEESAVKNMDHEVQTDPSSQALPQLEELLEKREASVEVPSAEEQTDPSSQAQLEEGCLALVEAFQQHSLNDEKDTISNDVIEDICRKEEILEESAVKNMDLEVQTDPSSQAQPQLEELLEKRGASSEVTSSENVKKELLEKREASPLVSFEDMATIESLPDETGYISSELQQEDSNKEVPLDEDSVVQDMDHTLQTAASTPGHVELNTSEKQTDQLLVKREASPGVTADEEVIRVQPGAYKYTRFDPPETDVLVNVSDEQHVLQQQCDDKKKQSGFFCGFQKMMSDFFYELK